MAIIGYGEDGLTYWGLSSQLQTILTQLGDNTPQQDCRIFYRPSFGRRQFGEFDGILATRQAVYLIESKWDNVAMPVPEIALDEVQTVRHDIFSWLRQRWQQQAQPRNWHHVFNGEAQAEFARAFRQKRLPAANRLLARNLAHILQALEVFPVTMRNVLLYFHRANFNPPQHVVNAHGLPLANPEFELVCLHYQALGNSGYFEIVP